MDTRTDIQHAGDQAGLRQPVKKASFHILLILLIWFYSDRLGADVAMQSFDAGQVTFELTDHAGNAFTQEDIKGKYTLLAFGFTHCRHICPMMVANMGLTLNIMDGNAMGVFISVDTERDTPEIAHAYASGFNKAIVGLAGDYEQIQKAATSFGVSFVVTKSQKAYTVEHTSDIFVIDPDGRVVDTFALNANPAEIAAAMQP